MITLLQSWQGAVDINGKSYDDIKHATSDFKPDSEEIHIVLHSAHKNRSKSLENAQKEGSDTEYKVTVRAYMTKPASVDFDFMEKWNNNKPMPLRTMIGTIEKETKGMVYMKLHGFGEKTITCMRCGKELTNPISRLYGIGPECIHKIPMFANIDIEEAERIRDELVKVEWEGWIIKSAIITKEEI